MKTFASLFGGGDLAGIGARDAGLKPIWTVECEPDIAAVAEKNLHHQAIVARVEDVDYRELETPDWLHFSPSCKNASVANSQGGEAPEDVSAAQAVARAIADLMSPEISLENVWGYRTFKSFRIILDALQSAGYQFNFWHLNSANYGIAQTRKRLILLASLRGRPQRPRATHTQFPKDGLFESLPRWRGWYEAIEDIVDTLPECDFAEWQYKRLPEEYAGCCLVGGGNSNQDKVETKARLAEQPAFTIAGCNMLRNNRAFIVHPTANNDRFVVRTDNEPVFTVKGNGLPRAFIIGDQRACGGQSVTLRNGENPIFTIDTRNASKLRAFIVDGKPKDFAGELQVWTGDRPDGSITATQPQHPMRAFVINGDNASQKLQVKDGESPNWTLTASQQKAPIRAWLSCGRIVQMTVRAYARFQSIPDSYVLPEDKGLASRIVGNALPPLWMQRTIEGTEKD